MSGNAKTADRFLGGRIVAVQPEDGFRAGHDTVLLAAAVPAVAGGRILELGAGAGVASLCLAARVPGTDITGVEIDADLVRLANANAALNGMAERVRFIEGDILGPSLKIDDEQFDHVFLNPPFHPASGQVSPFFARDRARATRGFGLAVWFWRAIEFIKPTGTITAIIRADRLAEVEKDANADVSSKGVALTVLPLFPHQGEEPKRVIVRITKGSSAPLRTLAGMVLHEADGRNTEAAEAVLRHAAALDWD